MTIARRVHVVGRQGHGKTTSIEALVAELRRRGLVVGTVKHSSHRHELDNPGKDSHRHRLAGAAPAAIVTPELVAVYAPRGAADPYAQLEPLFRACDLVLVEGHLDRADAPQIEVWRAALGEPPLACEHSSIGAVVSADPLPRGVTAELWRPPLSACAARLLELVDRRG